MALTVASIVQIAGDALSCQLDGETTILNTRTGNYFGLDEVAASVWRLMSEPHTVAEIISSITAEYDVEKAQCEADLLGLITLLAAHGLVDIRTRA